jgi:hypothetical protein
VVARRLVLRHRLLRLRYQEHSPEVWSCSAALGRRGTTAGVVAEVVAVRVGWSLVSHFPSYRLNCRYPPLPELPPPELPLPPPEPLPELLLGLDGLLLVVVVVVVVVEDSFTNTIVIVTNADGGTVALQVPLADPRGVPPPLPLQEMSLPRLLLIPQPAYTQPSLRRQEALQEPDTCLVTPFRSSLCLKAAHPPPPEALHELRHTSLMSSEQQDST